MCGSKLNQIIWINLFNKIIFIILIYTFWYILFIKEELAPVIVANFLEGLTLIEAIHADQAKKSTKNPDMGDILPI